MKKPDVDNIESLQLRKLKQSSELNNMLLEQIRDRISWVVYSIYALCIIEFFY